MLARRPRALAQTDPQSEKIIIAAKRALVLLEEMDTTRVDIRQIPGFDSTLAKLREALT